MGLLALLVLNLAAKSAIVQHQQTALLVIQVTSSVDFPAILVIRWVVSTATPVPASLANRGTS